MNDEAFRNSLRIILHDEKLIQKNIDFLKEVEAFLKRKNKDVDLDQLSFDDFEKLVIFLVF